MTASIRTADLREALERAGVLSAVRGTPPDYVTALVDDSRKVHPGAAFVAVRGSQHDGHQFIPTAEAAGMAFLVAEEPGDAHTPAFVVSESRRAVEVLAAAAAGYPTRDLQIVGVTGTSGKTTTVSMLRHLLDAPDRPAASIGTLGVLLGSAGEPMPGGSGLTTPGPIELHALLRELVQQGVRTVAMEASSHALDQHRVDSIPFAVGVFTNLSRDHLDYHPSMEAYLAAKLRLSRLIRDGGAVVVNAEEPAWRDVSNPGRVVRFAVGDTGATVHAEDAVFGPSGSSWTLCAGSERAPVQLPLIGDFNVANALAAAAAAWALGMNVATAAERLSTLPQVPGRLERLSHSPTVLRDYAHKPDALDRALDAVRPFTPGKLILLFGCGGDRDRGKRPIMSRIAEQKADVVILTSDNPRTEDPERILDEIQAGMTRVPDARIEDRRAAIEWALRHAGAGDVVLLAGKGHETYQIRGTESSPFDEKAIVHELLAAMGGR